MRTLLAGKHTLLYFRGKRKMASCVSWSVTPSAAPPAHQPTDRGRRLPPLSVCCPRGLPPALSSFSFLLYYFISGGKLTLAAAASSGSYLPTIS